MGRHWSKWPEGDWKIARENCREACGAGAAEKRGVGDEVGVYTRRPVQGFWHFIYGRWRATWEFEWEDDTLIASLQLPGSE